MNLEKFQYDNSIVRKFAFATLVWGIVGMLVGLIIAILLYLPQYLGNLPFLSYGRLRPLHTNAVIFAFMGNSIFMGVYYSLPRLLKTEMYSKFLSLFNFWGWQFIILLAALTLPLGITTSKEYAELEWPIDILIALVWVAFGLNMILTLFHRREKHLYVAIWFYIATFVTVAILHIGNSIEIPVSFFKSYSIYAGVQDALVQWWYGHNAVAFFLTTPFLGFMYYFIPKAANRPVYSYRLSIVHFWALIFIYIWAGPHHLLYSALPDWTQTLGTVFSIMLIAPSWGGMINGLLTLRGCWDRVRQDPVLKFLVVGITAYGMATFEGPMMSLKNVNALVHYTDYIIGHVHLAALAWNGGLTAAMLYYIIPRIYRKDLYSIKLANAHFWLATLGIVFYAIPMYIGGITQSLMWKQFTAQGTLLYPNFLDTVIQIKLMYILRSIGGLMYLTGYILLCINLFKTARSGNFLAKEEDQAPARVSMDQSDRNTKGIFKHRLLEGKPMLFTVLVLVAVVIGGLLEYIPMVIIKGNIPTITSVRPYTPLELEGRDLYIREGCNNCHSQLIRPFRSETERYGEYSKAGEFVYDHPFLWGSKRTGPDLHRIGGKYGDLWHYQHFKDPRLTSPGSIMPSYPWLISNDLDTQLTAKKIKALTSIGVDYPPKYDQIALSELTAQSLEISNSLAKDGQKVDPKKEVIAMIAYLQRLGKDIKAVNITDTKNGGGDTKKNTSGGSGKSASDKK